MINFNSVDPNSRASQTFIEVEGKRRSVSGGNIPQIGLIPGQYDQSLIAGIADYVPVQVFTADDVGSKAGFGFEAHREAVQVFSKLGGFSDKVWWVPIPEPAAAVKASGTIVFAVNASSSGTQFLMIGGILYSFGVANSATPTTQGDSLVAAITAELGSSVTAANVTGTVTVTSKTAGVNGNEISIIRNPGGETQSSLNPGGTTVTVPGSGGFLTSGAGVTDTHDMFFNSSEEEILGDRFYTCIAGPYSDATNLGYYKDSWDARIDPGVKRPFDSFIGFVKDSYSSALAKPATINSEGISMVWDSRLYAPAWELQAAVMGLVMASATFDPGRPFKTLSTGLPYNTNTSDLSYARNDALFRAGMGYFKADSGEMRIGDLALTYRTNAVSAPTEEWFDSVSMHRRQQKIYDIDNLFSAEPYTQAMVTDNTSITTKAYVIKPKQVIADLSNLIDGWGLQGWTKNVDVVKASLAAEINTINNSRIDAEMTDDEAQALRIIAMKYAFLY